MKDGGFISKHLGSFCGGSIAGGILGINLLFTGSPTWLHLGFIGALILWVLKLIGVSVVAFCSGMFTAAGTAFAKNPAQGWAYIKKLFSRKKKPKLGNFGEQFPPTNNNHKKSA